MNRLSVLWLCFAMTVPALAQNANFEKVPGQIDFTSLSAVYGEPRVMIKITGPLMKLMAAAAASSDDPEAAAFMRDLKGIRVNVYDTGGNQRPALDQMATAKAALEAEQWQPIVQVKEAGKNVQMFTRVEGELMQGMVIMVVEEAEAVFLNIIGTIDPTAAGKLMDHLNIDVNER